jgi:hypothetical protein
MSMTTHTPPSDPAQAEAGFDAYTAAMDSGDTPLLGHLVLYSIFDGRVKRDDLERWFLELGLDSAFLPPPIRPVDAFEKVTGPSGVRATYPLDGAAPASGRGRRRRPTDGKTREATLMVRHVRRDNTHIVRHLVREVRDEQQTRLSYDARLGECVFHRDTSDTASAPGAGSIQVTPDHAAINTLPDDERVKVYSLLQEIRDAYNRNRVFLTGDRLRTLIRSYIEHLGAIRVRPTGGVYFVHHTHHGTLAKLRQLVAAMGAGSHLVRIPIPNQDEMREMIVNAFTTKAKDDLDKLARDIATAQTEGFSHASVQGLFKRFQALQAATAEHSELLSTSLDDTDAALQLVKLQFGGLLTTAE